MAAHRHADPKSPEPARARRPGLDRDEGLEKDRTRRYETANGLARDIERNLPTSRSGLPPSAAYRLGKFARRHKMGKG